MQATLKLNNGTILTGTLDEINEYRAQHPEQVPTKKQSEPFSFTKLATKTHSGLDWLGSKLENGAKATDEKLAKGAASLASKLDAYAKAHTV